MRHPTKIAWKRVLLDTGSLVVGTAIMAVALNMFLIPHRLAAGGISGLAVILFHLFKFPVGLTIVAANIPLFIAAYYILGPRVVLQSFFGTLLFSAAAELLGWLIPFTVTEDILLAAVYGGVVMGIGLGLVFRARGSTGGTSLLALILNRTTGLSSGQGLLGGDLLIIILAAVVFGAETALYAVLSLFISSWVIDLVVEGPGLAKAALIITGKGEEMNRRILHELGRGVTRMAGEGGYTGQEKAVLLCVVNRQQVAFLKDIVHEADPAAFMIIGSANEVFGEGFRRHYPEKK